MKYSIFFILLCMIPWTFCGKPPPHGPNSQTLIPSSFLSPRRPRSSCRRSPPPPPQTTGRGSHEHSSPSRHSSGRRRPYGRGSGGRVGLAGRGARRRCSAQRSEPLIPPPAFFFPVSILSTIHRVVSPSYVLSPSLYFYPISLNYRERGMQIWWRLQVRAPWLPRLVSGSHWPTTLKTAHGHQIFVRPLIGFGRLRPQRR